MNPYTGLSDEKLMQEYQKGNNMAFEVLFNRHQSRVYPFLFKRVQNTNSRDEIFQNIFFKFHKVRHNYSSDYAFIKWLFTISKSEVADYFKYKKSVFIQFNEEAISTISEFTPEIDIELDSLNNLSSNEKKALKLRYYSENDFQEISKALGTSKANARKIA